MSAAFSIENVVSALDCFFLPILPAPERRRVDNFLQKLKQDQSCFQILLTILITGPSVPSENQTVLALTLLHDWVQRWWNKLTPDNREQVKAGVSSMLTSAVCDTTAKSIISKMAAMLSSIVIRMYPQLWPTFMDDLVELWTHSSYSRQYIAILTVEYIVVDCMDSDFSSTISSPRKQEIITGLKEKQTRILHTVYEHLCSCLESLSGGNFAADTTECKQLVDLTKALLGLLGSLNLFAKTDEIFAAEHPFHSILPHLVACRLRISDRDIQTIRSEAVHVLYTLAQHKIGTAEGFDRFLRVLAEASSAFSPLIGHMQRQKEEWSSTEEQNGHMLKELGAAVSNGTLNNSCHVLSVRLASNTEAQGMLFGCFGQFLEIIKLPISRRLAGETAKDWMKLFRDEAASTLPTMEQFSIRLLYEYLMKARRPVWMDGSNDYKTSVEALSSLGDRGEQIRAEITAAAAVELDEDSDVAFTVEFEEVSEWRDFFAVYKSQMGSLTEAVASKYPRSTLTAFSAYLHQLIDREKVLTAAFEGAQQQGFAAGLAANGGKITQESLVQLLHVALSSRALMLELETFNIAFATLTTSLEKIWKANNDAVSTDGIGTPSTLSTTAAGAAGATALDTPQALLTALEACLQAVIAWGPTSLILPSTLDALGQAARVGALTNQQRQHQQNQQQSAIEKSLIAALSVLSDARMRIAMEQLKMIVACTPLLKRPEAGHLLGPALVLIVQYSAATVPTISSSFSLPPEQSSSSSSSFGGPAGQLARFIEGASSSFLTEHVMALKPKAASCLLSTCQACASVVVRAPFLNEFLNQVVVAIKVPDASNNHQLRNSMREVLIVLSEALPASSPATPLSGPSLPHRGTILGLALDDVTEEIVATVAPQSYPNTSTSSTAAPTATASAGGSAETSVAFSGPFANTSSLLAVIELYLGGDIERLRCCRMAYSTVQLTARKVEYPRVPHALWMHPGSNSDKVYHLKGNSSGIGTDMSGYFGARQQQTQQKLSGVMTLTQDELVAVSPFTTAWLRVLPALMQATSVLHSIWATPQNRFALARILTQHALTVKQQQLQQQQQQQQQQQEGVAVNMDDIDAPLWSVMSGVSVFDLQRALGKKGNTATEGAGATSAQELSSMVNPSSDSTAVSSSAAASAAATGASQLATKLAYEFLELRIVFYTCLGQSCAHKIFYVHPGAPAFLQTLVERDFRYMDNAHFYLLTKNFVESFVVNAYPAVYGSLVTPFLERYFQGVISRIAAVWSPAPSVPSLPSTTPCMMTPDSIAMQPLSVPEDEYLRHMIYRECSIHCSTDTSVQTFAQLFAATASAAAVLTSTPAPAAGGAGASGVGGRVGDMAAAELSVSLSLPTSAWHLMHAVSSARTQGAMTCPEDAETAREAFTVDLCRGYSDCLMLLCSLKGFIWNQIISLTTEKAKCIPIAAAASVGSITGAGGSEDTAEAAAVVDPSVARLNYLNQAIAGGWTAEQEAQLRLLLLRRDNILHMLFSAGGIPNNPSPVSYPGVSTTGVSATGAGLGTMAVTKTLVQSLVLLLHSCRDPATVKKCLQLVGTLLVPQCVTDARVVETVGREIFGSILLILLRQEKWSVGMEWECLEVLLEIYTLLVLGLERKNSQMPVDVPLASAFQQIGRAIVPCEEPRKMLMELLQGQLQPHQVQAFEQELLACKSKKEGRAVFKDLLTGVLEEARLAAETAAGADQGTAAIGTSIAPPASSVFVRNLPKVLDIHSRLGGIAGSTHHQQHQQQQQQQHQQKNVGSYLHAPGGNAGATGFSLTNLFGDDL